MISKSGLLLVAAAALLHLLPSVSSFGGFFGRQRPDVEPAVATDNVVVFGVSGTTVTLQIQLDFASGGGTEQLDNLGDDADGSDAILFKRSGNQLRQSGGAEEEASDALATNDTFAWIVPLPSVPSKIETGSSLLMDALQLFTRPVFSVDIVNGTTADDSENEPTTTRQFPTIPGGGNLRPSVNTLAPDTTCSPESLTLNCPIQGPTRGGSDGDDVVVEQGTAGILDYVVLQGDDASQIIQWLQDNGYSVPDDTTQLQSQLQSYLVQGHVFVAVQLSTSAPQASVASQPLLVEFELTDTTSATNLYSVPLSFSHSADLAVQVYFFTDVPEGRVVPVNYLDVTLDNAHVNWIGCLSNPKGTRACYQEDYIERFQTVIRDYAEHSANASMVTEYAGPTGFLADKIMPTTTLATDLGASTTWLEFVTVLETNNIPPNARLQAIIAEYVPLNFRIEPPFQCATWTTALYHPTPEVGPTHEDCFALYNPPADYVFDAVGLTTQLVEELFVPAQQAQEWVNQFSWMTRFLGYIPDHGDDDDTAPTMIKEPYFAMATATDNVPPEVGREHKATATPVCAMGTGTSPTILEITFARSANGPETTIWQPARLQCPTWIPSDDTIFWTKNEAFLFTQGQGTPPPEPMSYALSFVAHAIGGAGDSVHVDKDNTTGGVIFDPADLEAASAFGDSLLEGLLPTPTPTATTAATKKSRTAWFKVQWPELVGLPAVQAKTIIEDETSGDYVVVIIPHHAVVTDQRLHRILIHQDDQGNVASTPMLG